MFGDYVNKIDNEIYAMHPITQKRTSLNKVRKYTLYNVLTNLIAEFVQHRKKFLDDDLHNHKESGCKYEFDVRPKYDKVRDVIFNNEYEKIKKVDIIKYVTDMYDITEIITNYLN